MLHAPSHAVLRPLPSGWPSPWAEGCEPGQPAQAGADAGLPRWEGHAVELFDDNIDPAAVGLSLEGPSPRSDAHLRERAQTADVVARVRVQTVTVDSIAGDQTYHLGVQVGVPTLTQAKVPDRSFELSIKPASGASGSPSPSTPASAARPSSASSSGTRPKTGTSWCTGTCRAPTRPRSSAAVKEAVALRRVTGYVSNVEHQDASRRSTRSGSPPR